MGSSDNNRLELIAIEEILPKLGIKPRTLLEVGSHNGHDCCRLRGAFGIEDSDIYIVEAHPTFYEDIVRDYPRYNVFNFAASDKSGVSSFHSC